MLCTPMFLVDLDRAVEDLDRLREGTLALRGRILALRAPVFLAAAAVRTEKADSLVRENLTVRGVHAEHRRRHEALADVFREGRFRVAVLRVPPRISVVHPLADLARSKERGGEGEGRRECQFKKYNV